MAGARSAAIERLVTEKHLRAWTSFVDGTDDILIAFEDDAGFLPTSGDRLAALLSGQVQTDVAAYIDLAGGFPLRKIVDPGRAARVAAGVVRFDVPFGNTTAGYLATRPLVEMMLREVTWQPELRHAGADWLVNELLMRVHSRQPVVCLHADPPIFTHGTFTGAFESSISPRPGAKSGG
jgi:hypothetical protein